MIKSKFERTLERAINESVSIVPDVVITDLSQIDDVIYVDSDEISIDNDGIGEYEFWGQQCNDKGCDYPVLEKDSMWLDVTDALLDFDFTVDDFIDNYREILDIVSGSTSAGLPGRETDVDWVATPDSAIIQDGRVLVSYKFNLNY